MKTAQPGIPLRIFLYLGMLLGAMSCSDDFFLFGINEEVPVIYAFIKHQDSINYIRISKTLQPDQDFSNRYSNHYSADSVIVTIEVWKAGERIGYPLRCYGERVPKDSGFFTYGAYPIYTIRQPILPGLEYRLFFQDTKTSRTVTAKCIAVSLQKLEADFNESLTSATFSSLPDIYFYKTICRFHYVEISERDTVFLSLDYPVSMIRNPDKKSGRTFTIALDRIPYWDFLPKHIPVKPGIIRYALKKPLEYRIIAGDEYLLDYLQNYQDGANDFNASLQLSNISGGIGLFSSYDEDRLLNLPVQENWYDKLAGYSEMRSLNFRNYPWDL